MEIWLGISKCQYNCPYCVCESGRVNEDNILKNLNMILDVLGVHKHQCKFILTGGEPGLLSRGILDEIFHRVGFPLTVSTNGLFVQKNYVKRYKNLIKRVLVHLVPETYQKKFKEEPGTRYVYGVTVKKTEELLEIPTKTLNRIGYLGIDGSIRPVEPFSLYTSYIGSLMEKNSSYSFIRPFLGDILKKDVDRYNCRSRTPFLMTDLENNKILTCMNRRAGSALLTEGNIYKVLTELLPKVFPEIDKTRCNTCYSQCLGDCNHMEKRFFKMVLKKPPLD